MSYLGRCKVDANQPEIVHALRRAGCLCQSMAMIGDGCPDLLVGLAGVWCVMEVKDGSRPASERKLSKHEEEWHAEAARHGLPVFVVDSVESALEVIGLLRKAA